MTKKVLALILCPTGVEKGHTIDRLLEYISTSIPDVSKIPHNEVVFSSIDEFVERDIEFITGSTEKIINNILKSNKIVNYVNDLSDINTNLNKINTNSLSFNKLLCVGYEIANLYQEISNKYTVNSLRSSIINRKHIFVEVSGPCLSKILGMEILSDKNIRDDYHIIIINPLTTMKRTEIGALIGFANKIKKCIGNGITKYSVNKDSTFEEYVNNVAHKNVVNKSILYPPKMLNHNIDTYTRMQNTLGTIIIDYYSNNSLFDSLIFYDEEASRSITILSKKNINVKEFLIIKNSIISNILLNALQKIYQRRIYVLVG